ncbi:hypothetical protein Tco_0355385 [Tanacetum coccineum]
MGGARGRAYAIDGRIINGHVLTPDVPTWTPSALNYFTCAFTGCPLPDTLSIELLYVGGGDGGGVGDDGGDGLRLWLPDGEGRRRVEESEVSGWLDRLTRSILDVAGKIPPEKFSGGGAVAAAVAGGGGRPPVDGDAAQKSTSKGASKKSSEGDEEWFQISQMQSRWNIHENLLVQGKQDRDFSTNEALQPVLKLLSGPEGEELRTLVIKEAI